MDRHSVFIVEDEFTTRLDLQDSVTRMGYKVAGATSDARIALQLVKEKRPNLVLMDIRFPQGIDGISIACQILKETRIPLIFVTAHTDSRTREAACAAEPIGFLEKPVTESDLRSALETGFRPTEQDLFESKNNHRIWLLKQAMQRALTMEEKAELQRLDAHVTSLADAQFPIDFRSLDSWATTDNGTGTAEAAED